jgi:hypothetical protein
VGKRGRRWRSGARAHGDGDLFSVGASSPLSKRKQRGRFGLSYFDQQLVGEKVSDSAVMVKHEHVNLLFRLKLCNEYLGVLL